MSKKALTTAYAGTGLEPTWTELEESTRQSAILRAFNYYSYHFDYKQAASYVGDYLFQAKGREADLKQWKKAPARSVNNAIGWLARMIVKGYPATKAEIKRIDDAIAHAFTLTPIKAVSVENTEENAKKKANVQEIMREKADLLGGELEYLLDQYIADNAKAKHNLSPITELKLANILPQHVPDLIQHWEHVRNEFKQSYAGVDKDLNEGYSHFTKVQLRNLVKFADLVIADLNSYVTFKKASRAAPKRKVKTPLQQVAKLKYMREFKDLKLRSVKAEKIIGSKEMFVFNTRNRKLQYYVADESAGNALMVKNNTIVGFDPNLSSMKTVRVPKRQITELMKASKPNTRKLFKGMRTVETKVSGRFGADLVILKVF